MIAVMPASRELKFRDPARARGAGGRRSARRVDEIGRDARVGDARVRQPRAGDRPVRAARRRCRSELNVIMGPGCPVCITDVPEVDEGVALARQGVRIATYGDMVRVPGTRAVARRRAGRGRAGSTSSTASRRRSSSRATIDEPLVFFATGFETTAVATAAAVLARSAAELLRCCRRTSTSRR